MKIPTTTNDGFEGVVKTEVANRFREYNGVPAKTFQTYQQPTVAASGTQLGYWYIDGGGTIRSRYW
jgi:hypothetical protein